MASQISDCEILVHVDAPALTTDDVAYRRLAQAYLDFQPGRVTKLPQPDAHGTGINGDTLPEMQDAVPSSDQNLAPASQNSVHPVTDSQDLSFEGALDNRNSPRLRVEQEVSYDEALVIPSSLPEASSSQQSWCAPPSEIGDSYPMPNIISHISPSRILRQWTAHQTAIPSTPNVTKDVLPTQLAGFASSQRGSPGGPRGRVANSVKAVCATASSPSSARKRLRDHEDTENDIADITHVTASDPTSASRPGPSPRAESEPVLSKRSKTSHESPSLRNQANPLSRSLSETTPRRIKTSCNSLEIWSEPPPVGVNDIVPSDLVSEKLGKLSRQLSSRYRPELSRDLQPFERGYWLVDSSAWNGKTHMEFWDFLKKYVEGGLAGWGVWCRRDEARCWVRFYCWGHIVKHIYLLLYLASGRQMKLTGAEWRDGGGEMVLRVPPTAKTL